MDTDETTKPSSSSAEPSTSTLPEAEAYATLLVTQYLVDQKLSSEVLGLTYAAGAADTQSTLLTIQAAAHVQSCDYRPKKSPQLPSRGCLNSTGEPWMP